MYETPDAGSLHQCENCGAELPAPDDHGTRRCSFCGAVYAARAVLNTPPAINITIAGSSPASAHAPSTSILTDAGPTPLQRQLAGGKSFAPINRSRSSHRWAWIIPIVAIVAVCLPLFLVQRGGGFGSLFNSYYFWTDPPTVVLPHDPTGPIPFVAVAGKYGSSGGKVVVRSDGQSRQPVWVSDQLNDSTVSIAVDAGGVYAVAKSTLTFLQASDGRTGWASPLTDGLRSSSGMSNGDSLKAIDPGHLLVVTKDGTLSVYNTGNGALAWKRSLQDVNAPVYVIGNQLMIVDGSGLSYSVSVVNPVDGANTSQFTPTCSSGEAGSFAGGLSSSSSLIVPSPTEHAAYFGVGIAPSCFQKWDLATGSMAWSTALADGVNFVGADSAATVIGNTSLYFAADHAVFQLDRASGAIDQLVAGDATTDLVPIATQGENRLILRAKDSRGTAKYALWSIDIATKNKAWQSSPSVAEPLDPPDQNDTSVSSGQQRFTVHVDGDKIRVLTVSGDTRKVSVGSLDAATGQPSPPTELDPGVGSSGSFFFAVHGWDGSRVLFNAGDSMLIVDTAQPSIAYKWP